RVPATSLLAARFTPAIIIDGAVIDEPPAEAFRQGRIGPRAFLIGSNHDEGAIFLAGEHITPSTYEAALDRDFPSWVVKLAAPSPGTSDASAYAAADRFEGDMRFRWDMWAWARLASEAGKPVYVYEFDHPTPCSPNEGCVSATRHGDEMPFVFGHDLAGTWSRRDRDLSRLMTRCRTHFAKTGSPDGCGRQQWPSYGDGGQMMALGETPHLTSMQPDQTMLRLDQFYRSAQTAASH
ncbi:MAG: carboxylesterase family protein, partial [Caulobacteraceae bacterium]